MQTKLLIKSIAAVLLVLCVAGLSYTFLRARAPQPMSSQLAAKSSAGAQSAQDQNVLRYAANAPQLSNLRIQPVVEVAEPASEPLPARIVYDEDRTARISSPVAGRVLQILAQPGDKVAAGQVLAWLDSPDFGSAVTDAAKAQADLRQKNAAYTRAKMLMEGQVLARKDFESAEADLEQARAEAQRTALKLHNFSQGIKLPISGERLALRAPIAGMVAERQLNPGAEVRPDGPGPLFVITEPAHLWALIDLPERDLGMVHSGQAVDIELDAYPDKHFSARVDTIGASLDANSRRIPVRCDLPNTALQLKAEMFARASLLSDTQRRVLRVPNGALVMTGLNYFVFVENAPGVMEKRRVVVASLGRDYAIVTAGLKAGERIVTSGALLLNSELSGAS